MSVGPCRCGRKRIDNGIVLRAMIRVAILRGKKSCMLMNT